MAHFLTTMYLPTNNDHNVLNKIIDYNISSRNDGMMKTPVYCIYYNELNSIPCIDYDILTTTCRQRRRIVDDAIDAVELSTKERREQKW